MNESQEVFWLLLGIAVGLGAAYIYLNLFPRKGGKS